MKTRLLTLGLVAASLVTAASAQTILQQWNFNDANGTTLTNTINTGTFTNTFNTNVTNVTTNGSGILNFNSTNTTGGFSDAKFGATPTVYTEGILTMTTVIDPWAFATLSASRPLFGFGFGSGTTANTSRLVLEYISTNQIVLDYVGGAAAADNRLGTFGLTTTEKLTVNLSLNITDDTYSVSYRFGTGETIFAATNIALDSTYAARDPNGITIRAIGNFGTSTFGVDSITVSYAPIPEPSAAAGLAGLGALGLVLFRRRRRA